MKLYDTAQAPNPRRVRIFMAEKGIECDNVQINIVAGENLTDEYLKINPRGLLPSLVLDNGTVLEESVAICRYLEETYPEPALMGTDPISKSKIEARQRHMEFDGLISAAEIFRNAFPGFAKRGLGGNVGEVAAIPDLVNRGRASVQRFFKRLDNDLGSSQFVAGDTYSIADITALCATDFATTAGRVPFPDDCPNLKRWYDEVSSRPSSTA